MANIKYADLLPEVLQSLAARPSEPEIDIVVMGCIKRAVIEFCAESWIWKHLPDPMDVVAGESACDLEPLPGSDVAAVLAVDLDGTPLAPQDISWLNREIPRWRTVAGTPRYFTQVDTEQILLAPLPSANQVNGLTFTLALQPSQTATGFPKWLFSQYSPVLAEGALARLMLMPGKSWTDINTGAYHRARFEAGIGNARASAVSALGGASLRVTGQH